MNVKCTEHGELDSVTVDGYSVGHWPGPINPRDLEGIEFQIDVDGDVTEEDVSASRERYLEKFSDWRGQVVRGIKGEAGDAIDMGLICPECGGLTETVRIEG